MSNDQISPDLPQETPQSSSDTTQASAQRPKVLIGSQRNPEAYRPKPSIPAVDPLAESNKSSENNKTAENAVQEPHSEEPGLSKAATEPQSAGTTQVASFKKDSFRSDKFDRKVTGGKFSGKPGEKSDKNANFSKKPGDSQSESQENNEEDDDYPDHLSDDGFKSFKNISINTVSRVPVPRIRGKMADDLEDEFSSLFAGTEMESLMANVDEIAGQAIIESETKLKGKIVSISSEDVFFDIGGRDQGIVALKQFKELPEIGQAWDVIVLKFMPEEGLYELSLPLAAADVREWEQIQEGMILSAKITGANTGGLECEVNKLRGFIPMSQIAVFRVEKPEEYVGQMLTCVVTDVNPMRRNLVLSRKVMLEREREELREKLLAELEVGQVREGLVRKIIDAGAFVDLGGVDGFIPIGALSWGRVRHPGDVLSEGSRIKVKITKMDPEAKRISLAYRDDADNPWSNIFDRFSEKSTARGKVTKIMDFGAFVELMPGVEGLVHISEISHKRVGQVTDLLKEGDWVDVMIQSIDPTSRRISLSIKQLQPEPVVEPVPETEGEDAEAATSTSKKGKGKKDIEPVAVPLKVKQSHKGPLRGGVGSNSDGEKFGLKW